MSHWQPDTELYLKGIPEVFDIADFCKFVQKGFCKHIKIGFARNVSEEYQNAFKAAVEVVKNNWTGSTEFPVCFF